MQDKSPRQGLGVFYILASEVTQPHFCCILLAESATESPNLRDGDIRHPHYSGRSIKEFGASI